MFGFICGRPVDFADGAVILENNGMGWLIYATPHTLAKCKQGGQIQLFTHVAVREDDISVYGFYTKEEREVFLLLNTVSGIGAKTALGILAGIAHPDFIRAVAMQDLKLLSSVKGVGKKTAERIIVELKDKLGGDFDVNAAGISSVPAGSEAVDALINLGLTRGEAQSIIGKIPNADKLTPEQLLKAALKEL